MNVADALAYAAATLEAAGVAESRRETSSLLTFVLARPGSFLFAHPEYELTADEESRFSEALGRRAKREPFQYITGKQEFYRLDFEVAPGVLIPRPETEILVEAAIQVLASLDRPQFLEIGVGSGCISISIFNSVPNSSAIGIDISPAAIAIAERNAEKHGVNERFEIREGNIYAGIDAKFDLIVSNPPYIPDSDIDELQPEVRDFEPHSALAGGISGLDLVSQIVSSAPKYLQPAGSLLMEIGFGQSEAVRELFPAHVWTSVEFLPDLQGIPRIVAAKLSPP